MTASISLAGGGAGSGTGSCGAFNAGLLSLSAAYSPGSEELTEQEMETLKMARPRFQEFRDWFMHEFGGVTCRDVQIKILGRFFNVIDDREREEFYKFQEKIGVSCSLVTNKTAVKLAQMLSQ